MEVWIPNNKNRLKKTLLGSIPEVATIRSIIKKPVPISIQKVLEETQEDLESIRSTYEKLGVEVLSFPTETMQESLNVRNGFIVVDDQMYITSNLDNLTDFYDSIDNKKFLVDKGEYCPDIYIHDDYAILDRLEQKAYRYWRQELGQKRKIITAFNEGHSDGIYCNVADKLWLTNGDVLPYGKYWPNIPVMELSTTNSGGVNDWEPVERLFRSRELTKTAGRYMVFNHEMDDNDVEYIDNYLKHWVGYCDETLFDINLSVIDQNNVMVISQNSLVYDKLETLGINVHKVPFRHRMFWDGGIHCITNDLVREY
tara:strand:+ start:76 stop:1011 length:936 start_codon:yes stop_codon:yes gene_type:complete